MMEKAMEFLPDRGIIIPEHILKEADLKGNLRLIVSHGELRVLAKEHEEKPVRDCETLLQSDFRDSRTIEELAEAQGVKPLQDITVLFGTWPGEEDDGFEEEIRRLRQRDISKNFES